MFLRRAQGAGISFWMVRPSQGKRILPFLRIIRVTGPGNEDKGREEARMRGLTLAMAALVLGSGLAFAGPARAQTLQTGAALPSAPQAQSPAQQAQSPAQQSEPQLTPCLVKRASVGAAWAAAAAASADVEGQGDGSGAAAAGNPGTVTSTRPAAK